MIRFLICILLCITAVIPKAQMRQIYKDTDVDNEVKRMSFYDGNNGYVAFSKYVGSTSDSGRSFIKKYITNNNVDFNSYPVNLTFGFGIEGVHAFNKDTLLVYGHYGFIPAILYSSNQGNSFKVVFHSQINQTRFAGPVVDMTFPQNTNKGFALDADRLLQTVDRGKTWTVSYTVLQAGFIQLDFPVSTITGFLLTPSKIISIYPGIHAASYTTPTNGTNSKIDFISDGNGYLTAGGKIFLTTSGGASWVKKNDENYYPVGSAIKVVNDSTIYGAFGMQMYKSTDSGKIWEPLLSDNALDSNGSHDGLFFYNSNQFWSSSMYGNIGLTTNGSGQTMPVSRFVISTAELSSNNKIIFTNYSKTNPGYGYRWLRNRVQFSTSYNASFISPRQTIDTFSLIVTKNGWADTTTKIIETRAVVPPCNAAFSFLTDTSMVKFTAQTDDYGWRHAWVFGDTATVATSLNPQHSYTAVGNFTVKHKVYGTIDGCVDSVSKVVNIARVQNCLKPKIYYATDTFYTNIAFFKFGFDSSYESGSGAISHYKYDFGDGTPPVEDYNHRYDSAKIYNVCLSLQNRFTNCWATTCAPLPISMEANCNALFRKRNSSSDAAHLVLPTYKDVFSFSGKPHANNQGKRNLWTTNNAAPVNTGNDNNFNTHYMDTVWGIGNYFNPPNVSGGSSCATFITRINIDNLSQIIRHDIYDSITGCSDTYTIPLQVPTALSKPAIIMIPNPEVPQLVTFYGYSNNYPYSSVWFIEDAGGSFFGGAWSGFPKLMNVFDRPGNVRAHIASSNCGLGGGRELYYRNFTVGYNPCPIITPYITYTYSATDSLSISFRDTSSNLNDFIGNAGRWFFGDGDSAATFSPTRKYKSAGYFTVSKRYITTKGCTKVTSFVAYAGKPVTAMVYKFIGNGNWDNPTNWLNGLIPPHILPAGYTIIIDPATNGQCVLNVSQRISASGIFTVATGQVLVIPGNLIIRL